MKLTILGSGTYFPELDRHSSSYLIQTKKLNLVFDFGRGALDGLIKQGLNYYDLDAIFISHFHSDHFSDLVSLLHISLIEHPDRQLRKKDLIIYGPKGFVKIYDYLKKAFYLEKYQPKYKVIIKELEDNDVIKIDDCVVKNYKVKHSESFPCLSYRIESEDKILAYSGDSGDCEGLRNTCQNSDLAILEANLGENYYEGHLNGELSGKIAQESKVKKLILSHIHSSVIKNYHPVEKAKLHFKGEILLAKDGMEIEI
jgi:ribonuclease BN (tRNA processing enzyme)